MSTLLIDDQSTLPVDRIARTYQEGIAALAEQHWDILYLDHYHLGDFSGVDEKELTGYDIACLRIPADANQHSRVIPITIPADADQYS